MPNENEMIKELEELLQVTGDSMADVFDQMFIGKWIDDNNHLVLTNTATLSLGQAMWYIMQFRHKYLGYSDPNQM